VVLVAVLALLALSAALIAGAFAAARGAGRGTRSSRAGIVADAASRRAIARILAEWAATGDSLRIGGFVTRAFADSAAVATDAAEVRARLQRVSSTLFVVAAEADVPSARAAVARRRVRVLLERAPTIDSTLVSPLRPLARWSSADLD
jgi:hypothetical protein